MKAAVYSLDGNKVEDVELPRVFDTPFRPDVIQKAYVNLRSHFFQRQGRDPLAGERTSAESRQTGLGIARMARAKGQGFPRAGQAAGVSGVVKGRPTHPPVAEKIIWKRLNKKEKKLALSSAIAATTSKELVGARGHSVKDLDLPLIVSNEIEKITRAKDLAKTLNSLKLSDDLERVRSRVKRRSGKSRMRGRVRREGKSVLIVVEKDEGVGRSAGSIPGVEVTTVKDLSVLHLAPGSHPGRLTLWSKSAIEGLRPFTNHTIELMEMMSR
ncbi:MAG: 50S ribosomal protein L4 [Nitrososphaerales archaeon]